MRRSFVCAEILNSLDICLRSLFVNSNLKMPIWANFRLSSAAVFASSSLFFAASAEAQTLLYVSNEQGNSIDEIRTIGLKGEGALTYVSGLGDPNGIVFSGKTLYEADTGSDEINEFTTTVTGLHTTITETNLASGLDFPGWIAIQPVPEPAFFGLAAVSGITFFIRRRISR